VSIINCSNLTKEYRKTKALNNMSFTIEENKITGLIGRNGAGKTTLLKIIAGYIKKLLVKYLFLIHILLTILRLLQIWFLLMIR
jgi:ABC-type multidrug transport system ATPase subunit